MKQEKEKKQGYVQKDFGQSVKRYARLSGKTMSLCSRHVRKVAPAMRNGN